MTMSNAYKNAGVDIEAGYEAVERMKKHVSRTKRQGVLSSLGGFGGMFDLSALNVKKPVLVSGTDGVGTKLMVAMMMDEHDTIGIDCVAMCVNDVVAQGAEPLFFLDYIACGKAFPEKIETIVKGISEGCLQAGCSLIGGETAEMPGMYSPEEYDLAGFTVGVVEKGRMIDGSKVSVGDVLIGLPSSGIHSNGYSLVRKVLLEDARMEPSAYVDELGCTLGDELLRPTRIYVKPVLAALETEAVHGISHITGGGFYENIPRMLKEDQGVAIEVGTWEIPAIYQLLMEKGSLTDEEMYNVFNMGIGMVLAVEADKAEAVIHVLERFGEQPVCMGSVTGNPGVHLTEKR